MILQHTRIKNKYTGRRSRKKVYVYYILSIKSFVHQSSSDDFFVCFFYSVYDISTSIFPFARIKFRSMVLSIRLGEADNPSFSRLILHRPHLSSRPTSSSNNLRLNSMLLRVGMLNVNVSSHSGLTSPFLVLDLWEP